MDEFNEVVAHFFQVLAVCCLGCIALNDPVKQDAVGAERHLDERVVGGTHVAGRLEAVFQNTGVLVFGKEDDACLPTALEQMFDCCHFEMECERMRWGCRAESKILYIL